MRICVQVGRPPPDFHKYKYLSPVISIINLLLIVTKCCRPAVYHMLAVGNSGSKLSVCQKSMMYYLHTADNFSRQYLYLYIFNGRTTSGTLTVGVCATYWLVT